MTPVAASRRSVLAKTADRGYGAAHQRERQRLLPLVLAGGARCARCGGVISPGEPWDLGHVDGDKSRYAGPEHRWCNRGAHRVRRPWEPAPAVVREPEPEGLDRSADCWDVPWLKGLRKVPADATWPRLMTVPHPAAVGSLGAEFCRWADKRVGGKLRWWQRLAATRLLEVDAQERLVWEAMILSVARQCGKSWLLRELCLWRILQGGRFGEPQDVMHTGKDVAICKEVQLRARSWARLHRDLYGVREANGQEQIEYLEDGSRWMVRAKEAVYGYSVSVGAVDEAWKVRASSVAEGLAPTMMEREQPQLWLISTAHRLATSLMLSRRKLALESLASGEGDLLIEWSAPREAAVDDLDAWRAASPHWTDQRQELIRRQLERVRAGELDDDDEPDPEQFFRAQYLNQWPEKKTEPTGESEDLLPAGLWASLTEPGVSGDGPLWVAVEDDYGLGAAVAAVAPLADGRFEVDGWLCDDWDSAVQSALDLGRVRRVRQLLVGASLLSRMPQGTVPPPRPVGTRETRAGLPLLRDLAAGGAVVHDETTFELDNAFAQAQVKEAPAGLYLVNRGPTHLVKAVVWALAAAAKPAPVPVIA